MLLVVAGLGHHVGQAVLFYGVGEEVGLFERGIAGGDGGDDVFSVFHGFYGVFDVVGAFGENGDGVDVFVEDEFFERWIRF